MPHAFQCLNDECLAEWRMKLMPILPNKQMLIGKMWPLDSCPKCGNIYFEWLSHYVSPLDVYLYNEDRYWQGKLVITKV